jgi:hypothetical protein
MSAEDLTIRLHTQSAYTTARVIDLTTSWRIPYLQEAQLQVVEAVTLPGDDSIFNPFYKDLPNVLKLTGDYGEDSITMDADRTARFMELFRGLNSRHGLNCHDLLAIVQGWDNFINGPSCRKEPLAKNEPASDGTPYAVIAHLLGKRWGRKTDEWYRTHSCIGTGGGGFLGLINLGMPLAIFDKENTFAVYSNGAEASIHEAISPDFVRIFKRRAAAIAS